MCFAAGLLKSGRLDGLASCVVLALRQNLSKLKFSVKDNFKHAELFSSANKKARVRRACSGVVDYQSVAGCGQASSTDPSC